MSRWLGIDPGMSGALALIAPEGIEFFDTPTLAIRNGKKTKNVINATMCAALLRTIKPDHIFIEKVWAMPGEGGAAMGVTSAFNFGMGFGVWLGIMAALNIPHEQVAPSVWKRQMMASMDKEKDASRIKAMQLFPEAAKDLQLKKHHNRADAILIAEYGRRGHHYP